MLTKRRNCGIIIKSSGEGTRKTSKHGEKPQFERRIGKSESGKARSD